MGTNLGEKTVVRDGSWLAMDHEPPRTIQKTEPWVNTWWWWLTFTVCAATVLERAPRQQIHVGLCQTLSQQSRDAHVQVHGISLGNELLPRLEAHLGIQVLRLLSISARLASCSAYHFARKRGAQIQQVELLNAGRTMFCLPAGGGLTRIVGFLEALNPDHCSSL